MLITKHALRYVVFFIHILMSNMFRLVIIIFRGFQYAKNKCVKMCTIILYDTHTERKYNTLKVAQLCCIIYTLNASIIR
jgi:hypothetical protein